MLLLYYLNAVLKVVLKGIKASKHHATLCINYTWSCSMLQDKVEYCFCTVDVSVITGNCIKSETLKSLSGSVSGPHCSPFSFLIHPDPLFFSLISLGLDYDARQAEVNAAAGEVLWSLGESAQQSWLWSSDSHIHAALVSGWEAKWGSSYQEGFFLSLSLSQIALLRTNATPQTCLVYFHHQDTRFLFLDLMWGRLWVGRLGW